MNDLSDTPKCPSLPVNMLIKDTKEQWRVLSDSVGQLVDRYIFVRHYAVCSNSNISPVESLPVFEKNPHLIRIACEHGYQAGVERRTSQSKRNLPP